MTRRASDNSTDRQLIIARPCGGMLSRLRQAMAAFCLVRWICSQVIRNMAKEMNQALQTYLCLRDNTVDSHLSPTFAEDARK